MGRSRKYRGGAITDNNLTPNQAQENNDNNLTPNQAQGYNDNNLTPNQQAQGNNDNNRTPDTPPNEPIPPRPTPSAPPNEPIPPRPTPSAPPYEPSERDLPSPSIPARSPAAIIESLKPTCGEFTRPIPGVTSTLTWAQLRDLCTTRLTAEEDVTVTDPHEYFRSLVGADGGRLLEALRSSLNPRDLLDIDRTNEIQGLLTGWMRVRSELGLPPIRDPFGAEITSARLNPLACRITADRADLAEYSDKWRVVASFVEARPPIFKAVFAEVFIPTTITGGSEGGMACLEGFCDYAFIEMKNAITKCFPREHRELPTVLPPVTGVLKMRRGRTTVSAFLEREGADVEGVLTIEPYRDRIMEFLRTTYPGVVWTPEDITAIFDELRTTYRESYRGGKTRRKRKRRKTKRRNYFRIV
jgi:hypothetical protein